jgi:predicted hotdog family 3-hydroxylacyl-ACP dehydratase
MIDRERLLQLIPHQGEMCLLDGVRSWDAQRIHAVTRSHARGQNPLRRDGRLSALHLGEYGAQAMAVHGGLLAAGSGARARPGLLVSLRGVELHCARIDTLEGEIEVHAEVLHADGAGWQYGFRIEHRGGVLASGRAAVMLRGEGE